MMRASFLRPLAGAQLTVFLLLVWVCIEGVSQVAFTGHQEFYQTYGLSRYGIGSMYLWQPLSYAVVHGGGWHMIMNGVLLLTIGGRLEWMLGARRLCIVLLSGALLGGGIHLALSQNILVGGSGAVFALILCTTTLSPDSRWLMPFPLSGKNLGRGLMSASLVLLLINPDYQIPALSQLGARMVEVGMEGVFRISHACHFGGALAGWLCALWVLRNRVSLEDLQRDRARREGED